MISYVWTPKKTKGKITKNSTRLIGLTDVGTTMNQIMETPKRAKSFERRLKYLHRTWWAIHYSIGITSIICAAILTAINARTGIQVPNEAIIQLADLHLNAWLLGIAATICGSLITLLGPLQKAERYCAAHHILEQAIMELEASAIEKEEFFSKMKIARKFFNLLRLKTTNKTIVLTNNKL